MGVELTGEEVFAMAEQIEQEAAAFYFRAASACRNTRSRRTLLSLAEMEADHEQVFSAMKTKFLDSTHAAPSNDRLRWPQLVQLFASGAEEALSAEFTGDESGDDILRKAILFEKETIVFFLGIKNMLEDPKAKNQVEGILKEEIGHVLQLTSRLATGT